MQKGWDTKIKAEALKKYTIPSVINILKKFGGICVVGGGNKWKSLTSD